MWERTALFIAYDENGGFFDHVPPPVAPPGTRDEYVTVSPLPDAAGGIAGPIGLGFRVPCLVVSPFSRGGLVCSDTFDHTSLLRFVETRFGVEVPNLSAWRRAAVGDLTSTLSLALGADPSVPALPATSLDDPTVTRECGPTLAQATGNEEVGVTNVPPYPPPSKQAMPVQEPGVARRPDATFTVVSAVGTRSGAVTVELRCYEPGRLIAIASVRHRRGVHRYGRASALASTARSLTLTIHPSEHARELRLHHGATRVLVELSFAPSCGAASRTRLEVPVPS